MKIIHATVALIASSVASAQIFTNCAYGYSDMTVTSFSLWPYPLTRGLYTDIRVTGTLSAPITLGATLQMVGTYAGTTVYSDTQNVCSLLGVSGVYCPVPITVTSMALKVGIKNNIPTNIPMTFKISATNGGLSTIFCQTANNIMAYL